MASNIHNLFSTLIILSTILFSYPAPATPQECQYPCFPPPNGPGNIPPATTTPPAPPVSTTPPAFISPPGGFSPFTPPPYYFGAAPPPPDPIVPWYPYYFRKPPHKDQSSSVSVLRQSGNIVVFVFTVFLVFYLVFH